MSDVRKKIKVNFLVIIFLAALIYISYLIVQQQSVLNNYNKEIEYYKQKIQAEKEKNEELKEKQDLYTSDEYIENIARDKLGLVKPGEKIFIDISE